MSQTNQSIVMNDTMLLLQNGLLAVREGDAVISPQSTAELGTVYANMAYYGYVPSKDVAEALASLDSMELAAFWDDLVPALAYISGADRKMGDFVVYKNFPAEVLDMDQATYWIRQVLMYWGVPNEAFTQDAVERVPLAEMYSLKVLHLAQSAAVAEIWSKLCRTNAGWTDIQKAQAHHIHTHALSLDLSDFAFKENGVRLAADRFPDVLSGAYTMIVSSATDVLRLAALLSEGDVSLRRKTKFRKFSRPERRCLLGLISTARHMGDDFALRREPWKRLLSYLRPSEFGFDTIAAAYDRLYRGDLKRPSARVEAKFAEKDATVLSDLKARPGDFLRRLHKAYDIFGRPAFEAFKDVTPRLTLSQLVKLDGYLRSVNGRASFIIPPRGRWSVAQIVENVKTKFSEDDLADIREHLSLAIGEALDREVPAGFDVSLDTVKVKLQSNGQELAAYGRGTVFDIPQAMTYVRTASYWKEKSGDGNTWFDNGWNFFDAGWRPVGTICWDSTEPFQDGAAVFSGDPTNSKDVEGRACQVIDLYLDKLAAAGVRYAVWNILCYSHIPFSEAAEVVAALQWGERPQEGEIFEPARAQNVFPLVGADMSKYVAYVDLIDRKMVYMDVSMRASVSSAKENEDIVAKTMSAYVEHLDSLPSVADLFGHGKRGTVPILYHDAREAVRGPAYVFDRRNIDSQVEPLDIEKLMASTQGCQVEV